jgi:CheY-like chemotaxis protein
MSTLLLVGREGSVDQAADAERAGARRGPSLRGALERVGYQVVEARDGAAALNRLVQDPPDLIVLSGSVPDMGLPELCEALRRDPAAVRVPFVLVAGSSGHSGREASRAGADLVFPPTVGPNEIADRLRRLF